MTVMEKALEMLAAGETVSGAVLARELGVSRNAVWKVMNQLRRGGYAIEAVTNRGYRLLASPDRISEPAIRRWLTAEDIGRNLEIHPQLDSTNNRAKLLASSGAPHGTVVIADSQTGGRGRLGRSFFSPEHSGIYLTCILRPDCSPERAGLLTSLAAVAVARAVEALAETDVKIKWVNDLYIGNKKICGILTEAGFGMETGQLEYAAVGIGVNVNRMEFPPELRDIATSVANETGAAPDRNRLIAEICNCMEEMYGQLADGAFMAESRARSNVIGRNVVVLRGGEKFPARAIDIDDEGSLIVETQDGVQTVHSGEVSVRWEDPV